MHFLQIPGNSATSLGTRPCLSKKRSPRNVQRLVIGTGAYGRLPVMKEVKLEAKRHHVDLLIVPTNEPLRLMEKESAANAIVHVKFVGEQVTQQLPDCRPTFLYQDLGGDRSYVAHAI